MHVSNSGKGISRIVDQVAATDSLGILCRRSHGHAAASTFSYVAYTGFCNSGSRDAVYARSFSHREHR